MSSSYILDPNKNFSLLRQQIPGTYNRYDRTIIRDNLNLTLPKKVGINNWTDFVRYKSFVKYPPRQRATQVMDLEELEAQRIQQFGPKVDIGLAPVFEKINQLKFPIRRYNPDGTPADGTEQLSLMEIINDTNDIRRLARLRFMYTFIQGDQNLNLQAQLMDRIDNQSLYLRMVVQAIADLQARVTPGGPAGPAFPIAPPLGTIPERPVTRIPFEDVVNDQGLMNMMREKFGHDLDEFLDNWQNFPDIELDVNGTINEMKNELNTKANELQISEEEEKKREDSPFEQTERPSILSPTEIRERQASDPSFVRIPEIVSQWPGPQRAQDRPPTHSSFEADIGLPQEPLYVNAHYYNNLGTLKGLKTALIKYLVAYATNINTNPHGHETFMSGPHNRYLTPTNIATNIRNQRMYIEIRARDNIRLVRGRSP